MNLALEAKNAQLNTRLEKLMKDSTGVSVMDFKINFSKQDLDLGRGRLIEELLELRQTEQSNCIKIASHSHEKCNQ